MLKKADEKISKFANKGIEEVNLAADAEKQAAAEETKTQKSNLVLNIAYAYIGAFARSINAAENIINKVKTDRDGLFNELVKSGQEFTQTYSEKVRETKDTLKDSFSLKAKKESDTKKEAEEKTDAKVSEAA